MKLRLKYTHPACEAMDKLCECADDLGIKIEYFGYRTVFYFDGKQYDFADNESGDPIAEFPPMLEYKLTFDDGE